MSWKSFLLIVLVVGVGGWYVLFGPGSCELLSDTKTGGVSTDLTLWVQENINSEWLNEKPHATEITVTKVKIKKITPTDKRFVEDAVVQILGNYTSSGESKAVSFKKQAVIRINRYQQPLQFTLLD